jgi:hypothetical protein
MTGAARLSRLLQPVTAHPAHLLLFDRARSALPTAIMVAEAAPRQGWKPVRVKTRQSRGFSEADSPIPEAERTAQMSTLALLTEPRHTRLGGALPFETPDAALPQILHKVGPKTDETSALGVPN